MKVEVEQDYLEALEAFAVSKPTEFEGYKLQYRADKAERVRREQRNKPKGQGKEEKAEKVKEEPKPEKKEKEQVFTVQIEPPVEVVGVLSEDDAEPAPEVEEPKEEPEIVEAKPLPKTVKKTVVKEDVKDGDL